MNKKIFGIFICMLLISCSTSLAISPFNRYEKQMKNNFLNSTPYPSPSSNGWMKTFGGLIRFGGGSSVQQTADGGYIITGNTQPFGMFFPLILGVWLIKTDGHGNKMWDKTFGGTDWDVGYSVQQTTDGGYIITGQKYLTYKNDVLLIKTNAKGNKVWERSFGGGPKDDIGWSVQQATDGGYIIAGETVSYNTVWSDVWLIKTDNNGYELWNRTFGGTDDDIGHSVQQTTDGGYIITGTTWSYGAGNSDFWLIKTNSDGIKEWDRTFGGTLWNHGYSVQQTTDEGYIIGGNTNTNTNRVDVLLIKTDSNGKEIWNRTFGGKENDRCYSVKQTSDGGYIIAGETESFGQSQRYHPDVWLIKTDSNGYELWNRTFGGTDEDTGYSVQQTTDGGYIITGLMISTVTTGSCVFLIKTDNQGKSKTILSNSLFFEKFYQRFPLFDKILKQNL